jgi:hypothetical protein
MRFGNVTLKRSVYSTGLTNNSSVLFCGAHLNLYTSTIIDDVLCFRLWVNIFLCVTQMGVCCVYFVFISDNLKKVIIYRVFVL